MISRLAYIIFTFGVLALGSCKGTKDAQGDRNVPNRKTEEILTLMKEHEIQCEWLSIKYEVEVKTADFEDSFKMYARLKQDSVIWVSATYYAVEVARFLFSPDSLKFMDRRNNQFYVGNYDYLTTRFGIDANFKILQSLLLANTASLLETEAAMESEKIKSFKDDGKYFLSFLRKGQLRRALRKDEAKKDVDLNIGLWIDPENFRMAKTSISDFSSDRTLTAIYSNYQETCNSLYPYTTEYVAISANEQAEVKTSVIKLSTGKEVSLSFTIPEKYEELVP